MYSRGIYFSSGGHIVYKICTRQLSMIITNFCFFIPTVKTRNSSLIIEQKPQLAHFEYLFNAQMSQQHDRLSIIYY